MRFGDRSILFRRFSVSENDGATKRNSRLKKRGGILDFL
jgi:hypothetical protein